MTTVPASRESAVLGLIVACTKSKHAVIAPDLRLGALERGPLPAVLAEWLRRLDTAQTTREALALYAGPAWASVRRAREAAVRHWGETPMAVISAGLGVIAAEEMVPAYSATFAAGEDAVNGTVEHAVCRSECNQRWLAGLSQSRAAAWKRALQPLLGVRLLLVAAGADYVAAFSEQLLALAALRSAGTFGIICAGGPARLPTPLQSLWLPAGDEWEAELRSTRSALNFRLLEWAVERLAAMGKPDLGQLRLMLQEQGVRLNSARPPRVATAPLSRTDDEVMTWIAAHLREDASLSKSRLLRAFRQEGSCEQGRFGRLVGAVRSNL